MEQFLNFAKNLSCGYISCNFKDAVTGQLVFEPYRIVSFGNMKIAFVGACTPGTISSSKPSNFIYDFDGDPSGKKLCASIQRATDSARENGADKEIPITQAGTKLKYIGQLTIKPSGEIITELINSVSGRDEKIDSLIHGIKARYEDKIWLRKFQYQSFRL